MDETDKSESLNECPMSDEHAILADAYSTAQRAHFLKRGETQNILNHKWKLEFELLEAESYPIDGVYPRKISKTTIGTDNSSFFHSTQGNKKRGREMMREKKIKLKMRNEMTQVTQITIKREFMAKSNKQVLTFPSPKKYIPRTDGEKAIQNEEGL